MNVFTDHIQEPCIVDSLRKLAELSIAESCQREREYVVASCRISFVTAHTVVLEKSNVSAIFKTDIPIHSNYNSNLCSMTKAVGWLYMSQGSDDVTQNEGVVWWEEEVMGDQTSGQTTFSLLQNSCPSLSGVVDRVRQPFCAS
jgi:hypothetical protein